jgi:alpha-beta hydrolase superfamily lysophospholipase
MSHGYGAWSTHYSNLGEHLASMGYIVASIDHADQVASGVPSLLLSFANVLSDRAQDQRQILEQIKVRAQSAKDGFLRAADVQNVGLIGYSMGGYGALSTAGAPYDYTSETFARLPEQSKKAMQTSAGKLAAVKAVVAIAPWGGAPDARAWNAQGLAKMDKPLLIIAGNQDDVVNFKDGISWLFSNLKSSNRHMLVYREARHNVAGNAFDTKTIDDFATLEFLREPVWRTDRINAINQHFVTAFFDMELKGDTSKAAYLALPAANSNDSVWPVGFGEQLNGERAGAEQKDHWRGFQRRWAVGLEMQHKSKGE